MTARGSVCWKRPPRRIGWALPTNGASEFHVTNYVRLSDLVYLAQPITRLLVPLGYSIELRVQSGEIVVLWNFRDHFADRQKRCYRELHGTLEASKLMWQAAA